MVVRGGAKKQDKMTAVASPLPSESRRIPISGGSVSEAAAAAAEDIHAGGVDDSAVVVGGAGSPAAPRGATLIMKQERISGQLRLNQEKQEE